MILSDLMNEKSVLLSFHDTKKAEILREMVECLSTNGLLQDKEEFASAIFERENVESTAVGGGVAIPHGRSSSVSKLSVIFGRTRDGVDFESLDGKPVNFIFMVAAPLEASKEYLQAIAKVARLLKSEVMRKRLLEAETVQEIMDVVKDFDQILPEKIEVKTKEGRVIYKNKSS